MAASRSVFNWNFVSVSFNFKVDSSLVAMLFRKRDVRTVSQVSYRFIANMADQKSSLVGSEKCAKHRMDSDSELQQNEKRNISVEHYLSELGASLVKIRKQLDITRLSLDRVKEKVGILEEIGLQREHGIGRLLSQRPSVLVLRDEVLLGRVKALKKAGIEPAALAHVIKRAPGVLTAKTDETLSLKIKFLQGLAVKPRLTKEAVLHLLTKCPDIIASCSMDSLKDKINFFEKVLKFNQHQIRNIILKQPAVLTFSKESMTAKYQYCYEELYASRTSIARCPRLFQCSLKRIQERHLYLKHVGRLKEEMAVDDYGLGVIVSPTDKYFAEKVALSSLEEFNNFRHSLSS